MWGLRLWLHGECFESKMKCYKCYLCHKVSFYWVRVNNVNRWEGLCVFCRHISCNARVTRRISLASTARYLTAQNLGQWLCQFLLSLKSWMHSTGDYFAVSFFHALCDKFVNFLATQRSENGIWSVTNTATCHLSGHFSADPVLAGTPRLAVIYSGR